MEILGLLLFGLIVGLYGTLVGIGGGPLVIPVLTVLYHLPAPTIVATSISVVFLNALSGSIAYYGQRRIDLVSGTLFGVLTIPASLGAYFLVAGMSHDTFARLFAIVLFFLAGYVLIRKPPSDAYRPEPPPPPGLLARHTPRRMVDTHGHVYTFSVNETLGGAVNVVFGCVTTVLGIGGGILQVPMLVYWLRMPVHVATATAHFITTINTAFTLLPLLFFGHADPKLTLWLGSGVVLGARLGARLSVRFQGDTLVRLLAVVFLVAGIWMLRG
jgi:hypothetical protein